MEINTLQLISSTHCSHRGESSSEWLPQTAASGIGWLPLLWSQQRLVVKAAKTVLGHFLLEALVFRT
jgi:hypothetical protein